MPKEEKDQYCGVQNKGSLGRRLFPESIVLGIPKRGDFQLAESVVMELRAFRGNSTSSEHTEAFATGHGEQNFFAERICELQ